MKTLPIEYRSSILLFVFHLMLCESQPITYSFNFYYKIIQVKKKKNTKHIMIGGA